MVEKKLKPWKPSLACDIDLAKISPAQWESGILVSAKIDGVRGMNISGRLVGRSLKEHKNPHITRLFSSEEYLYFDGELVTGNWTDSDLCRKTSGNCSRKSADSDYGVIWYVFDYLAPHMLHLPYIDRLEAVNACVEILNIEGNGRVRAIPHYIVHTLEGFLEKEDTFLKLGFEGIIARDPRAPYKSGRATNTMNNYLRLKRFIDFEGVIVDIVEALENTNEKKTNELGRSERSSHQENLIPKGMLGMLKYQVLEDVVWNGKVLMKRDQVVDVGPGEMDHLTRVEFWINRWNYLDGKTIGKAKCFPHGQKDLPRFPTHQSLRSLEDMS